MKHLAILISVIILKSCGSSQDVVNAANSSVMTTNEIISGIYTLEQLDNTSIGDDLILEFDPKTNRVSGFAGCNRFFGTYSTNENTISLSELGATRMMCQEEVNKIELKLFQTLAQINRFELSKGKLRLKKDETTLIIANESMNSKSKQRETINIIYKATTRGFFETIWIEGDVLRYTNDRYLKEVYRHQLSQEQLSELMAIYDDLDIESIPALEPPSTTFQYDAAAMATLEIKKDKHTYKTNVFDHGNPPKAISEFVKKVLSIKESITKQ